jgi:hypothetical protein
MGRVSPFGRAGAETSGLYERRPRPACHYRAIHSGPGRSSADSHGQRHSGLDLRHSLSSQVAILPDLALGAGGRFTVCDGLAAPADQVPGRGEPER